MLSFGCTLWIAEEGWRRTEGELAVVQGRSENKSHLENGDGGWYHNIEIGGLELRI
jgi:hypothetical protein